MSILNKIKWFRNEILSMMLFVVALLVIYLLGLKLQNTLNEQIATHKEEVELQIEYLKTEINEKLKTIQVQTLEYEEEYDDGFVLYDIPLDKEIQRYIFDVANEYGISYELMLAIAKVESGFNPEARNKSGKEDSKGLFQINSKSTLTWLANETGLGDEVDPYNPYHSTIMAVWYISWLTDYYTNKGLFDEILFNAVLMGYSQGIGSANKFIATGITTTKYVEKVLDFKYQLESGEINRKIQF